jgi:hypothetical protein
MGLERHRLPAMFFIGLFWLPPFVCGLRLQSAQSGGLIKRPGYFGSMKLPARQSVKNFD